MIVCPPNSERGVDGSADDWPIAPANPSTRPFSRISRFSWFSKRNHCGITNDLPGPCLPRETVVLAQPFYDEGLMKIVA